MIRTVASALAVVLLLQSASSCVLAADCTTFTGTTVDIKSSECANYIFGTHSGLTITCTAQSLDGIFFTGTCTGCTLTVTDSTIKNGIIGAGAMAFNGGSISIKTSTAPMIAFACEAAGCGFSGGVSVTIHHNKISFDSTKTLTIPAGSGEGAGPVISDVPKNALAVASTQAMSFKDISIMNNEVTVSVAATTGRAETDPWIARAVFISTGVGSAGTGQIIVYGNVVNCVGCAYAGIEVAFAGAPAAASSDAYALAGNLTFDANVVDATVTGSGGSFAACRIGSYFFVSTKYRVSLNECRAHGAGAYSKIYGIRMSAPSNIALPSTLKPMSLFGLSFGACAQVGELTIRDNKASAGTSSKPITGAGTAYGLFVSDIVSGIVKIESNVAESNNPRSSAIAGTYQPQCLAVGCKFGDSWAACGITSQFAGTCPLVPSSVTVSGNTFAATGAVGPVMGWWFTAWAARDTPNLFGSIPFAVPFQWKPYSFNGNTVIVRSYGSNRTRGVYFGFEEVATLPSLGVDSKGNSIMVECSGPFPDSPTVLLPPRPGSSPAFPGLVSPAVCQGEAYFQGMADAVLLAMGSTVSTYLSTIKSWPFLNAAALALGGNGLTHVICHEGFQQCNALYIQTEAMISTYTHTWTNARFAQTELGAQAEPFADNTALGSAALTAAANAAMKRSSAVLFFRNHLADTAYAPVRFTISDIRVQFIQRNVTAAPRYRRSLFYFDHLMQSQPTLNIVGGEFAITRYLKTGFQVQNIAPVIFSFPFIAKTAGAFSVIAGTTPAFVVARHDDYCSWTDAASGDINWYPCNSGGPYARVISATPAGGTGGIEDDTFVVKFAPARFYGRMKRRCTVFFDPPLEASCASCVMQLGCQGCDNTWTGIGSSASSSWTRQYDRGGWCPTPRTKTRTRTYMPKPPKLFDTRTRTRSHALTESDELTVSKSLTNTSTLVPTPTRTIPPTRTVTISQTIPECSPGIFISATIMGGVLQSARIVEREPVVVQLRLSPPVGMSNSNLSLRWDVFNQNLTKEHIEIVPLGTARRDPTRASVGGGDGGEDASAQPFEIIDVKSRSLRVVDVTVIAPPGTNVFADDVGARFGIDADQFRCRWMGGNASIVSAAAIFPRRFDFVPAGVSQAVLALGLISLYAQAILSGSSGVTFWLAARRSIGFFDAVSCRQRKDATMLAIDSPMQLAVGGDDYVARARGALIGNTIFVVVFAAACLGASIYRSQKTWRPLFNNDAQNWAGAPAWIFPISAILLPGSVQAIVELLAAGDGVDIGLLCIPLGAISLATPALVAWHIFFRKRPNHFLSFVEETETVEKRLVEKMVGGAWTNSAAAAAAAVAAAMAAAEEETKKQKQQQQQEEASRAEAAAAAAPGEHSAVLQQQLVDHGENGGGANIVSNQLGRTRRKKIWVPIKPPMLERIFAPDHVWKTRRRHYANRYGTAFDRNTGRLYWITIAELLISFAGAICAGWPGLRGEHSGDITKDSGCRAAIVAHCFILMFGALLACNFPFSVIFDNVAVLVMYALGVCNAILQIVGDYKGDNNIVLAADRIVFTIFVICIVKGLLDVFRFWKVKASRTWAVNRLISCVTRKHAHREGRRVAARAARSGGGLSGMIGPDGRELTVEERELEEEREMHEMARKKELARRTLPPPSLLEPRDLTEERRKRQMLVEPMLDYLAAPKIKPNFASLSASSSPDNRTRLAPHIDARVRERMQSYNNKINISSSNAGVSGHRNFFPSVCASSDYSSVAAAASSPHFSPPPRRSTAGASSHRNLFDDDGGGDALDPDPVEVASNSPGTRRRSRLPHQHHQQPSSLLAFVRSKQQTRAPHVKGEGVAACESDSDDDEAWFRAKSQQKQQEQRVGNNNSGPLGAVSTPSPKLKTGEARLKMSNEARRALL